jgi:large subunit ribosomal protein L10
MAPKKINPKKTSILSNISDLLSKSKSVAIVDYKGLKVSQATDLRRQVRKSGGELLVTKNTLFKIAAKLPDYKLEGTSAFVFSQTDEVSSIKTVADFAKKNQLPTFKGGLLGDRLLTAAEVTQLSVLPDKATLIAKTLGGLKSPLFGLANALNWNISKLVRTLDAVRSKKEVTN